MDGRRIDEIARRLANRRALVGGLGGLAAGLLSARVGGAACGPDQVARRGVGCICTSTGRPPGADGSCPCPLGQTRCEDACVRLDRDPAHCGGCGQSCDGGVCRAGTCGCPAGFMECGESCAPADGCCIDGKAVSNGTVNPENECQACQPGVSTTGWSDRRAGTPCGPEGCGKGTCNGSGTCVPSTPVATIADCQGRCSASYSPATVTICGQDVQCPPCEVATCYWCDSIVGPIDGPHGEGMYCSFSGHYGSCSTRSDCPPGHGCYLPERLCAGICY